MVRDTIYALASGAPPSGIAIIRISGPNADALLERLTRRPLPAHRVAALRHLYAADGQLLDEAVVLRFAAGASATGEPVTELHCHGGRAVIAALSREIDRFEGLRQAEPGEFTRRAVLSGRIGINEAEALADLLEAETEAARRDAVSRGTGTISRRIEQWEQRVLALSASVEAELDQGDEDDVAGIGRADRVDGYADLLSDIGNLLARPPADLLREGARVVIAGPPNSGKSTLLNAILGQDAAIVTPIAGTTRDVLDVPVALNGVPFRFVDTAGLRSEPADPVEAIGIERARSEIGRCDLMLWLGNPADPPAVTEYWHIRAKADLDSPDRSDDGFAVSALTGFNMPGLMERLADWGRRHAPPADGMNLPKRLRVLAGSLSTYLSEATNTTDCLIEAEALRGARNVLDAMTGRSGTEDMLDRLFSRFCVGK